MKLWSGTFESLEDLREKIQDVKSGLSITDFVHQRQSLAIGEDAIAKIDIRGPLMDNPVPVMKMIGCTDYRDIIKDCTEAINQGAKGILLTVNSGGGATHGAIEAAKAIQELGVPVVAYVDGMACSAAYKLTVGADWIVARPSAQVGNIGTVLVYSDYSKMAKAIGIEIVAMSNDGADLKTIGHRNDFADDVQLEFLQQNLNDLGEQFRRHVSDNREVAEEVFRAGWYNGNKAIELGLIDEIGDEDLAKQRLMELIEITTED